MGFEIPPSIRLYGDENIAKDILSRIWGKRGVFTCTVASTMTSAIPGVSEAGDNPVLTGPADAEFLINGVVTCMDGVPLNPGGIPSPGTLTKAALNLSGIPYYIVNGGCKVDPFVPYFDVGGSCGESITTGHALKDAKTPYEKGYMLGELLSREHDFIIISESCAGGTTTALAVMTAMGTLTENLVSSSSPNNPKDLKTRLVKEALDAAGVKPGELSDDPLKAIELFGDPMMPANVGILCGAAKHVPVIVGGGTQMAAVMAAAIKIHPEIVGNFVQGTTRWLMNDPNSNMERIMQRISDRIPILYINMDYGKSPYEGLQAYERGFVKEGVGCGGSSIGAIIATAGRITVDDLLDEVHRDYVRVMSLSGIIL